MRYCIAVMCLCRLHSRCVAEDVQAMVSFSESFAIQICFEKVDGTEIGSGILQLSALLEPSERLTRDTARAKN